MIPDPHITRELLDYLEAKFPNRIPSKSLSLEDLHRLQGQQDVIRKLRHVHDEQSKTLTT